MRSRKQKIVAFLSMLALVVTSMLAADHSLARWTKRCTSGHHPCQNSEMPMTNEGEEMTWPSAEWAEKDLSLSSLPLDTQFLPFSELSSNTVQSLLGSRILLNTLHRLRI